jgi:hypothetical protein
MFSIAGPSSLDEEGDHAPLREAGSWIWPVGPRRVLAALVIAAALGLAVGSRAVDPPPGDEIVVAPKLKLDPNTAPPQVLGALPHVGPALVRQLVLARQYRPLTSLEDVHSRVRGIGPATLAQLAPYLRFEPTSQFNSEKAASSVRDRAAEMPRSTRRKKARPETPTLSEPRLAARSPERNDLQERAIAQHD